MPVTLTREEFLHEIWDYRRGEHVSAIEPTGGGKTYLLYQLADEAMHQNPALRFVSLMPKRVSPTTDQWAAHLGLRETPTWPPPVRKFWQPEPRGLVLWPPHTKSASAADNNARIAVPMRQCLQDQYWRGNSISLVDDIHVAAVHMGLNPECEQLWTAGREGGAGLWSANQKPSGTIGSGSVSTFCYSAPTHMFLGYDPDERNVKRFGEIGSFDPKEISAIVRSLRMHEMNGSAVSEKLYLDKRGPYKAIILPW